MTIDKKVQDDDVCEHDFAILEQVSNIQPYTNLASCVFCGLSVAIEYYHPLENIFYQGQQAYKRNKL